MIDEISKLIQSENKTLIIIQIIGFILIAVIQFFATNYFGSKLKKSIENKYNRSIEMLKNELLRKKSLFDDQLIAYKNFVNIYYGLDPEKTHPDMEWDEACEAIAYNFDKHYKELNQYLKNFGAILPIDLRNKIKNSYYLCSDGKFEITCNGVTYQGAKFADKFYDQLKIIENEFRKYLKIDAEIKQ